MTNRLAAETSLYLRQHADNPVAWQPWDAAALASARATDTPILLSIGYSACHWCHVMAHESFEDAATGALMNRLYVNIKVDREERPDLDRIYQLAHQALTRRGGGWPLTLFLDPHTLLPFYAGTYFPPTARHGLPAFAEVLQGVRRWWDEQRGQVNEQNAALQGFLADYGREGRHDGELSDVPLVLARERLLAGLDHVNGGHRGAPKFPHAGEIEFLLALAAESDADAARAASVSLATMARRGLHDHLAGGFFRYCVDAQWDIPHFEKMLYDNALLLPVFAQAAGQFGTPALHAAAEGIVAWLQAEMRHANGGYCSALDADSEGEEGRFYLWTRAPFDDALAPALRELAARHYGLDRPPNFEGHAWHLHAAKDADTLAATSSGDIAAVIVQLESARTQLLSARAQRVRPARDDKCLTAWNALLCSGLARAGQALAREDWLDEAAAIFATISRSLDAHGRLPAVLGRDGPGFLDDHAYALAAAMDLLAVRGSAGVLHAAGQLADALLRDFADVEIGGFFFTAAGHESLPQRPKPWLDDATPAGNGVAADALLRLGALLAEPRYLDAAEATLRAAWTALADLPQAAPALLMALRELRRPTPLVVVRGDGPALSAWRRTLDAQAPRPIRIYAFTERDEDLPPALAAKPRAATGRAVLCVGTTCRAETDDAGTVIAQLRTLD